MFARGNASISPIHFVPRVGSVPKPTAASGTIPSLTIALNQPFVDSSSSGKV